jgi:hypothetical protein
MPSLTLRSAQREELEDFFRGDSSPMTSIRASSGEKKKLIDIETRESGAQKDSKNFHDINKRKKLLLAPLTEEGKRRKPKAGRRQCNIRMRSARS